MPKRQSPNLNKLLDALPLEDFDRIASSVELISMNRSDVLYELGQDPEYVYFPTTSISSLNHVLENGRSTEIVGVSNEGVLGVSLLGGVSPPRRAIVQISGFGYRVPAKLLLAEFNRGGAVMRIMLCYTHALLTHISQNAVCNRHHSVEQQFSRWLLFVLDRRGRGELAVTQEMIANTLGVRREGVTEVAGRLQQYGFISSRRGHITVLDRRGLEKNVCECYEVVKREYATLSSALNRRACSVVNKTDSKEFMRPL